MGAECENTMDVIRLITPSLGLMSHFPPVLSSLAQNFITISNQTQLCGWYQTGANLHEHITLRVLNINDHDRLDCFYLPLVTPSENFALYNITDKQAVRENTPLIDSN